MSMSTLGQGPSPRKTPSSAMGKTLLGMDVTEDKGGNLLPVVTLQIILRNRKNIKVEKDNGENGNVWGKGCHYCIQCLVLDITMLFCLYNHSQQLERKADGTSTYSRNPTQEEGNYYKKGVEGDRKGGWDPPILSGKLSPSQLDREEHRVNRCPYTLKPSSLTHSLQIHCTGLAGLKSHASWAWAEKRDPAAGYINLNRDHLCLIKRIFKLRKWTSVYNCMLINLSSFDTKI